MAEVLEPRGARAKGAPALLRDHQAPALFVAVAGSALFDGGDRSGAILLLEQTTKAAPKDTDTLFALADIYADAALLWEGFGVVPEQGFALLGQGRCLLELSRPGESSEVLQQAREIFARCGMRPALEETDALLAKASALSS